MISKDLDTKDFEVSTLGRCSVKSPLNLSHYMDDGVFNYIKEGERILYDISYENYLRCKENNIDPITFEKAGPTELLYFDPSKTKVAIVTCGGLCPGLNNVIRTLVMELYHRYKVTRIIGIKYGFQGFIPSYNHPIVDLTPEVVDQIQMFGGSILGSSRGNQDVIEIVDALERMNINILFTVGGDGTLRGAHLIHEEIKKRGIKMAIGGIPKTIDNDINFIQRSFGFESAFSIANHVIRDAHNEAEGAFNGISLIKLMGRDSGFIAANAVLSMQEVNFVLIPELEFDLFGNKGFLHHLKNRLQSRNHALVVVAEGAGQNLFEDSTREKDASGNIKHKDIGIFLRDQINEYFESKRIPISLKYIDPSYLIRSAAANANDSKFCGQLAQNAVHAAMAGHTDFVVGYWNHTFNILPIPITVKERKKINLESDLWYNVLETTGQPFSMKN